MTARLLRLLAATIFLASTATWAMSQPLTWQPPPPECPEHECVCQPGPQGPPGPRGPQGPPGTPSAPPTLSPIPPYDLDLHGVPLTVRAGVTGPNGVRYLLVYTPANGGIAALVDLRTGLAQVQPMGGMGMLFDDVTVWHGDSVHFGWWSHGAVWGRDWDAGLLWQPIPGWSR